MATVLWLRAELPVRPPSSSRLIPGLASATMEGTDLPRQAAPLPVGQSHSSPLFLGMVMSL